MKPPATPEPSPGQSPSQSPGHLATSPDDGQVVTGIACLCAGLMFFSAQDAVFKLLAGDYSIVQLLMMRSLTAAPLLGLFLWWRLGSQGFSTSHPRLHAIRCTCIFVAFLCFYTAVSRVPLADAVALFGAAPLFITALAGPVLGESVGPRRWSAVCVGFVGVLIMLRPGTEDFEPITLLAAVAAAAYAASALTTRRLGKGEPSGRVAFYSNLTFLLGCGAILSLATAFATPAGDSISPLWHPYVPAHGSDLALMLGIGLVTLSGFVLVPRAYQIAPVSVVAPFEYTYLLWAMLIGYLFFDELPSVTTWAGAALVVSAGVYIARREAVLAMQARDAPNRA